MNMDQLVAFTGTIDDWLYTYVLVILLVFAGLYFTVRTKAVQIRSFLSEQKDVHVAADAAQPDKVIGTLMDLVTWLDQINPELAPAPGA